jgi:aspartate/methionine/tyrosine aminotransferase
MVPGVVQRAGIAALGDQDHAMSQRDTYWERLLRLRFILGSLGVEAPMPEGGLYLWAPAPRGDAWALAGQLARDAGLVVSPGEFYGEAGRSYVRVAAVAPMQRIELVASRLGAR